VRGLDEPLPLTRLNLASLDFATLSGRGRGFRWQTSNSAFRIEP
jgi:hypothetical protein